MDPVEGAQKTPPDPEEGTLGAPSDLSEEEQEVPLDTEETQEAPPDPEEETREAPSDSEEETKDVAGLAAESVDLEGSVVPVRRKLTISGNLPPNNDISHVESTGARRKEQRRKVFCRSKKSARKATRRERRCATAGAR